MRDVRPIDPLVEEPAQIGAGMLFRHSPKIFGGSSLPLIRVVEVPHGLSEPVLIHGLEIEHHSPEHMQHPGTLLVHQHIVSSVVLRRSGPVAQPNGAGLVVVLEDVEPPTIERAEVLAIVLAYGLEIPQTREAGKTLAQPLVVVTVEVHADPPPLMGDFVGAKHLVLALPV